MKKIILTLFVSLFAFVATAQTKKVEKKQDYMPNKGNFTVSLLTGKGFFGSASSVNTSVSQSNVSLRRITAPVSLNSNSLTNMVGVEGKYFLNNRGFAVTLSLGGMVTHHPEQVNIPAVIEQSTNKVLVPGYSAVVGFDRADIYFSPGLQWNFRVKRAPRLTPYYGVSIPVNYGRYSYFDPKIDFSTTNPTPNYGMKHSDYVGLGIQGVFGMDYYLTNTLFIGFDVKPFSYHYAQNSARPRPGTILRRQEQISYSFFSNYLFKFGFRL